MVNRKIIFFAILFVGLLAISTVSAADNSTDDIINLDSDTLDLAASADSDVVAVDSDDDSLSATQEDVLSASQGKYKDLSDLIGKTKENGILKLNKDYKYDESFTRNGITIDKPITIDGNGHTIDGNNLARAFYVTADKVTIKNIQFKNCYMGDDYRALGGSIYWTGGEGLLSNCQFSNSRTVILYNYYSSSYNYGGAVYWSGYTGKITNCDFKDCYSTYDNQLSRNNYAYGGAVYWYGSNGAITNSRFTHCTVNAYTTSNGGAVQWSNSNGVLQNCQFTNCFATSQNTANGAAVSWSGSSGLIENCRFVGNSKEKENGVVYISGDSMDVESSYFFDNAKNYLYWTGRYGQVHNSVLYKMTTYYPVYSSNYNVDANYNWWGNTNLDFDKKLNSVSRVIVDNWLYLTASTNKNSLFVGETANININLNNLYSNDGTTQYKNSKLPYVTFTVTDESFTNYVSVNKGSATYTYVAKSVPMDPVIVQFDTHVNIFKYTVKKVGTKLISPQVNTVYNSGKYIVATLKDAYNRPISTATVGITIAGKTHMLSTNFLGQVKVSLNGIKPKKYTAKVQFVGDKNYYASSLNTKVIIKKATPKLKVTKKFKSKSKKKLVKVTVKDGAGPIKKVKVTLKVKGKTYKAKTNKKGLAKFDVSKKLKKAGKYKASIKIKKSKLYNKVNKKVKIVVKK